MKSIAGYLMIVCLVIGGCLGLPLSAKGEENPPERPVVGQEWHDPVSGIDFVWVPEGCFQMGSPESEKWRIPDEGPVHEVCLDGFWMGKYEVTQAQWTQVMGKNPSCFTREDIGEDISTYPVECVSWDNVQEFISTLNKKAGKEIYRLPSEAEWEYAARAGTQTAYSFGNDAGRLGEYAWYIENSGRKTHPVGQLKPNAWGLYDMLGNVWEWCQDWFAKDYYSNSPKENPPGPVSGSGRVVRGGPGWFSGLGDCRSADRYGWDPRIRFDFVGFRLVRTPQLPTPKPTPSSQRLGAPMIRLRSEPLMVSNDEFRRVFGLNENKRPRQYIENNFKDQGKVVVDHATGLMWQKSGSVKYMTYQDAQAYINNLNRERFAGYNGWRLPTVEELMSLLEPKKSSNGLYIHLIFDKKQKWCWSSDKRSSGSAWLVYFLFGHVGWDRLLDGDRYVRAVRSLQD